MSIGQKSFLFFLCFLAGVGAVSFGAGLAKVVLGTVFLFLALSLIALYKKDPKFFTAGLLSLAVIAGGAYVRAYVRNSFEMHPFATGQREIYGTVVSLPQKTSRSQGFILETSQGSRVFVRTDPFRSIGPGDTATIKGKAEPLIDTTRYLRAQKVSATFFFPEISSVAPARGFSLMRILAGASGSLTDVFYKTLGNDQAALMAGILLGQQNADFSADFKQAMKNSGTTHLVALSGYNITVLISAIFAVLVLVVSRKRTLWLALGIIFLFVIMTGAQSSVVRAAIMGILAVVAPYLNRVFSFKHAMAAAAFIMTLVNPLIIRFDIGFALSFLSLFGLTYAAPLIQSSVAFQKPWLKKIWDIFSQTAAAQLMVLPLLAAYFGQFSLAGLVSNVLILPLTPLTMALGFFQGIAGLLWEPLARVLSLGLSALLSYEVGIIKLFGSLAPLTFSFGIGMVVLYYIAVAAAIKKYYPRIRAQEYTA